MFRNDRQAARCNRALLAPLGLADLWTAEGPTPRACELLDQAGGGMSAGEALMLRVTFDLWNGRGGADLGRLLAVLDADRLRDLGELLAAMANGPDAVAGWLAAREPPAHVAAAAASRANDVAALGALDRNRAAYEALDRHLRSVHGIDPPMGSRAHLDAAHARFACDWTPEGEGPPHAG